MRRAVAALSFTALLCAPRLLHATTAAQLCAGDPCVLGRSVALDPASVLDFGNREFRMTVRAALRLTEGDTLVIKARSLVMQAGALIDQTTPPNSRGATVTIQTTGGIQLQRSGGTRSRINLSAGRGGGKIILDAGGNVDVDGDLSARGLTEIADGGTVTVQAGGNVALRGEVTLLSGGAALGGELEVDAIGSVVLGTGVPTSPLITVGGGLLGGTIDIVAGRTLTVGTTLDAAGNAVASDGGDVELIADGDVTIGGQIIVQGPGSELAGGFGGDVAVVSGGSLALSGTLLAWGGAPDGEGGTVDLNAALDLTQAGQIVADGRGPAGFGGAVELHAGRLLTLAAKINVHGNDVGGDVTAEARAEVRALAEIDAGGTEGGSVAFSTTDTRNGELVVAGPITVSGNIHASGEVGGSLILQGCDVTVSPAGIFSVSGSGAPGVNLLQSSGRMSIAGTLLAQTDGLNQLQYLSTAPQILPSARIVPGPLVSPIAELPRCQAPVVPVCGNGTTETAEACDDGNMIACDGCSAACKAEECGNGTKECAEVCDDGNLADGDGCDSNCKPTGCGNGVRTDPEACDDGAANGTPESGCTATCGLKPPPGCGDNVVQEGEECDEGANNGKPGVNCSAFCTRPRCGDNIFDLGEECDDGNTTACDGCSATCKTERCGNRIVECGREACDDGNQVNGDGCDNDCTATGCGNGIRTGAEQCDDGNFDDCDGCSTTCQIVCGNGRIDAQCGEECDAGAQNGQPGAECSPMCEMCTGRPECPCAADTDCGPGGQCGGFACDRGLCVEVSILECDDGNACNGTETCSNGSCQPGTPVTCPGANTCNPQTCVDGTCVHGTALDCRDADECTEDVCAGADGCVHATMLGVPGIDCQIRAMTAALGRAEAVDVTTQVRTGLQKLLTSLQQKATQAATAAGNAKRERKAYKAIRKLLGKVDKKVSKASTKHQIAPALATQLTTARDSASRAIETLLAP